MVTKPKPAPTHRDEWAGRLTEAVINGYLDKMEDNTVELLKPVRDAAGNSPLYYATAFNHLDQVRGVTPQIMAHTNDRDGVSLLHRAAEHGSLRTPDPPHGFWGSVESS